MKCNLSAIYSDLYNYIAHFSKKDAIFANYSYNVEPNDRQYSFSR